MQKKELSDAIATILTELTYLVGGIVLVGLGSNFYLAFGLAALLIYNKPPVK